MVTGGILYAVSSLYVRGVMPQEVKAAFSGHPISTCAGSCFWNLVVSTFAEVGGGIIAFAGAILVLLAAFRKLGKPSQATSTAGPA